MTRSFDAGLLRLFPLTRGKYTVAADWGAAGLQRALPLRNLVFRQGQGDDRDRFDADCLHVVVQERATEAVVCSYRVMLFVAADIGQSYSAQFYDLARLSQFGSPVLELGRFSLHPERSDPDILRLAWAAMARIVDARAIGVLFGCTSFAGTSATPYQEGLRWLGRHHLGPSQWCARRKSAETLPLAPDEPLDPPALRQAMAQLPPLLRTYLAMGGWVSDHAVLDRDLNTLHVFTAVEIASIPPARAKALREIAAAGD